MEAEALTTYTSALQDDPEAIEPAVVGPVISGPEDIPAELSPPPAAEQTFASFGIAEPICAALAAEGITTTFPIQALTLPVALTGHDLIGQARTGTGKTLAFGVPILQRLDDMPGGGIPAAPRALVVVPTRELAIQVAEDLQLAGKRTGAKVVVLYGGRAYEPQIEALSSVDIVVGTPGRLLDLVRQRHLNLGHVRALVLDEADKMLDLGFLPDVEKILSLTPRGRQTMLFSATMPGEIVTLARRHLSQPMHIRAEHHDEPSYVSSTQQHIYRAHQLDKIEVLSRVLQSKGRGLSIVFCRTKRSADQVAGALTTRGFAAAAVHGDLGQGQRERAMRAFRSGKVDVLVATDVAARGLDVDDVTHVINYECPEDEKAYLHRIGRTGRAGRTGVAVTFVDWNDLPRWKVINELLSLDHADPVETYSTSDHLFTDLDIPAGATGTLPRAQRERLGLEAEQLEDIGETGKTRSPSSSSRGRGRRGGSGSDGERGTFEAPRDPAKRKQRVRRRTRGGVAVANGQDPAGTESGSADAAVASTVSASPATSAPAEGVTSAPGADRAETAPASSQSARRRRRRSSRGRGKAAAASPAADGAADHADGAGQAGDPAVSAGSADA